MGNKASSAYTPMECILRHWESLGLQSLRKKRLVFLCTEAWTAYVLEDGEAWPPEGSINYNTIRQLDSFCHRAGKWSEVAYVQAFFALRNNPHLCRLCKVDLALLTAITTGAPTSPPSPPELSPAPSSEPPASPGPSPGRPNTQPVASIPFPQEVPTGLSSAAHGQVPFSTAHLGQVKGKLGSFSDDPDSYIGAFEHLTAVYYLTWKDVMVILTHTLTWDQKQAAFQAAETFANEIYMVFGSLSNRGDQDELYPIGVMAVPQQEPCPEWKAEDPRGEWKRKYFIACLLQGLRRIKSKPVNYSRLCMIHQDRWESPLAFLQRLREALEKHTTLSPDSVEGQLMLKDKFITQSAPDIRRKLQKQAFGPESTLENLLNIATKVFYNRDQEENRRWERKARTKATALAEAAYAHQSKGSQGSLKCYSCGHTGHFKRECPHSFARKSLQDPVLFAVGITGRQAQASHCR
ncbi:uncharacterized protein LOC133765184 [Lepus europaeus]|uniref:uncharacterized protein LOC133765184 n=1 Tax=Lepus europaeus TaxID=9983 RepID=UPI002B47FD49|nr:uncharacterized protein LOC133765184 [Lepus europaeus]